MLSVKNLTVQGKEKQSDIANKFKEKVGKKVGKRIGRIFLRIGLLALLSVSFFAMVVSDTVFVGSKRGIAGVGFSAQVQQSKRMGQATGGQADVHTSSQTGNPGVQAGNPEGNQTSNATSHQPSHQAVEGVKGEAGFFGDKKRNSGVKENNKESEQDEVSVLGLGDITAGYVSEDNSGYPMYGTPNSGLPLGGHFARLALWVNGGEIEDAGNGNVGYTITGKPAVGFESVEFRLTYADKSTQNIGGTGWSVSSDSYAGEIGDVPSVGVVGTGALLVQKKYDRGDAWGWDNTQGGHTDSLHSVNYTDYNKPSGNPEAKYIALDAYQALSDSQKQPYIDALSEEQKSVYDDLTEQDEKDGFVVYCYNQNNRDRSIVYTPAGEDLKSGVYLRFLFAYELKKGSGNNEQFVNVVEQTVVYLANNSGLILFQNLYLNTVTEEPSLPWEVGDEQMSEVIAKAGNISHGHASNHGFKVNFNGNQTYWVGYTKDNASTVHIVQDGMVFREKGRYNFIITTRLGITYRRCIYINDASLENTMQRYFPSGFVTPESHRLLGMEYAFPVFKAGETAYATGKVDTSQYSPLTGKLMKYTGTDLVTGPESLWPSDKPNPRLYPGTNSQERPLYETINTLNEYGVWTNPQKTIKEPGEYIAEFATSADWFAADGVSLDGVGKFDGDVYHIVFRFVVSEDSGAPSVNQDLLQSNTGIGDYKAKYFATSLPSAGVGKVIFANPTYNDAYAVAYQYYRSFMTDMEAIDQACRDSITNQYFDASNPDSYLTVADEVPNILDIAYTQDVIVFSDAMTAYCTAIGTPYLNDKAYNYLDKEGQITTGSNPVQFISVADYESASITLTDVTEGREHGKEYKDVPYNTSVQAFLESRNALSGAYQITEQNKYGGESGTTVYTANYIRPGDNTTQLTVDRQLNGVVTTHTMGQAQAGQRLVANAVILQNANNDLDAYGLVKVIKNGEEDKARLYQLDEVQGIQLDTEGQYTVCCVDRLGNTTEFGVAIYNANRTYTLTLLDGDTTLSTQTYFGGQTLHLPTLPSTDDLLEFGGWQDAKGAIYQGTIAFDFDQDTTLTALWLCKKTHITVIDGKTIAEYETSPNQEQALPKVSKPGYDLWGYKVSGQDVYYRGVIPQVPNVAELSLTAVWVDYHDPLQVSFENGQVSLPKPQRPGVLYYGWLYTPDGVHGQIFDDWIDSDAPETQVTLYSLWTTDPESVLAVGGGSTHGLGNLSTLGLSTLAIVLTTLTGFFVRKKIQEQSGVAVLASKLFTSKASKTCGHSHGQATLAVGAFGVQSNILQPKQCLGYVGQGCLQGKQNNPLFLTPAVATAEGTLVEGDAFVPPLPTFNGYAQPSPKSQKPAPRKHTLSKLYACLVTPAILIICSLVLLLHSQQGFALSLRGLGKGLRSES
ncbi:MAG: hypothetical protein FWD76_04115, partial [Firmicutes bacterium]|nr:hypothetical protein [Bacillota bacterium]